MGVSTRLGLTGIRPGHSHADESPDSYGPALKVRRDQMASFLLRSVEYGPDRDLGSERQTFDDVPASNSHSANVNP